MILSSKTFCFILKKVAIATHTPQKAKLLGFLIIIIQTWLYEIKAKERKNML